MPELPEVETLVQDLRKRLVGRVIESVKIGNEAVLASRPRDLEKNLPGRKIVTIERQGKFLQFRLTDRFILWFHLGMTGQLLLECPGVSSNPPHSHFFLFFKDSKERLLYRDPRRFGRIALEGPGEEGRPEGIRRLGREPREWEKETFASLFKTRRGRIKSLLLDQRLVSGLGNIYADESLHRAGIHPLRRAHRIRRERLFHLHEAICEVLEEAVRWGGSSIDDYVHVDGSPGRFQEFHRVYGREGERCFACGARIRAAKLAGRTSSFCPRCQT